jgi:hypothetical protein
VTANTKAEAMEADGNEGDLTASIQRFAKIYKIHNTELITPLLDTFTHQRSLTWQSPVIRNLKCTN